MSYIFEYDDYREILKDASIHSKENEALFWSDLIGYWNRLLMNGQIDLLKQSVCHWKIHFSRHFSEEAIVARDIAEMLYDSLLCSYP